MKRFLLSNLILGTMACATSMAITPNPCVSEGIPANLPLTNNTTTYLTDGKLTNWMSCNSQDIAINVGSGPSKLFVTWESYGDCAWANYASSTTHTGTSLKNFKIMTSANSTNGQDGDWTEAIEVKDNPVMARGVYIDFEGMSWIRIVSSEDVGQLLEIGAYDMSNDGDDTWFFMGTSISQMGLKQQDTDSTTAELIHAKYPDYSPAMLRGGIGCINSTDVVNHLSEYIQYAGNVHHWAIEMGTNDAWGGGDWNLETFRKNMQTIIDTAQAHGIEIALARIIATNESIANWQVNPKFLEVIDTLIKDNNLIQGPDFYNYFLEHPELISTSDGVHPNGDTKGGQAMHHLWAEALYPLYEKSQTDTTNKTGIKEIADLKFKLPYVVATDKDIKVSNLNNEQSQIMLIAANGQVIANHETANADEYTLSTNIPAGIYFVIVSRATGTTKTKVIIK